MAIRATIIIAFSRMLGRIIRCRGTKRRSVRSLVASRVTRTLAARVEVAGIEEEDLDLSAVAEAKRQEVRWRRAWTILTISVPESSD